MHSVKREIEEVVSLTGKEDREGGGGAERVKVSLYPQSAPSHPQQLVLVLEWY